MTTILFPRLNRKEQRGSKPRCHLLTRGSDQDVAERLTGIVAPFATVSASDHWMPSGFDSVQECQLHRRSSVLDSDLCGKLAAWWLPEDQLTDRTPNFDIAATCSVDGRPGIILVEAKAHDNELIRESEGRKETSKEPIEQRQRESSHRTIRIAIDQARAGLNQGTGLNVGISLDRCYQMSNRFAWAWKLAESGVPVVLVYLGFLNAEDMSKDGRPFNTHEDWEQLVRSHAAAIVPGEVWERKWEINGSAFIPIIRSISQSLMQPQSVAK